MQLCLKKERLSALIAESERANSCETRSDGEPVSFLALHVCACVYDTTGTSSLMCSVVQLPSVVIPVTFDLPPDAFTLDHCLSIQDIGYRTPKEPLQLLQRHEHKQTDFPQ